MHVKLFIGFLKNVKSNDMDEEDYEVTKARLFVWDQWVNEISNADVFDNDLVIKHKVRRF